MISTKRRRMAVGLVAAVRVALGAGMLARPALLPTVTGEGPEVADRLRWLVRMLGGREVALGLGALASRGGRGWVAAGLLSDAGDTVALVLAARDGSLSPVLAAAGTATSFGAVTVGVLGLLEKGHR